jgi:hypothetical protein
VLPDEFLKDLRQMESRTVVVELVLKQAETLSNAWLK